MEIIRDKEFVNQFHYDARNLEWEKEHGTPKSKAEVTFQLIKRDTEANETVLVARLQYMIVKEEFVISGVISQGNRILNRILQEPSELSQEEVQDLAAPLLDMLKRLTYEVTEIALDRPGINLEF
ncbi:DUF1149 family protein [Streptococcus hillyeri]|uniref:DUF1149 family protein n=1 Tax=Streptococcus hillyeri TaxID=2282420 RepID=A0A3L9DRS2_9STRE|nr:DUF1149 family protein [Streptococcus hillyeri]RLY04146.1 DUF1149 family protein [Streptococcus hillyeri]